MKQILVVQPTNATSDLNAFEERRLVEESVRITYSKVKGGARIEGDNIIRNDTGQVDARILHVWVNTEPTHL